MGSQDTEITLGTGKMLALFFALVALCGLFFGLGFSLGRGTVRSAVAPESTATTGVPLRSSTMKSAGASGQSAEGMTFYKAVEQKDAGAQAAPDKSSNEPPTKQAPNSAAAKGALPDPMTVNAGAGYVVQVAAVSKQDDAQALVEALKKKQYTAFTSSVSPSDKFFHVQVGPFSDIKDAEATRAKLVSDGYNPILKK
jgi:DedD protein